MNRGLVRTRSRDFQLSPILMYFPDVNIDGAPRCCCLIPPHQCCTISSFLLSLQTELKNKSKMRAVLQAISLPSRSVKKNIESAKKQYQSKSILSLSVRITESGMSLLPNQTKHGQVELCFTYPKILLEYGYLITFPLQITNPEI